MWILGKDLNIGLDETLVKIKWDFMVLIMTHIKFNN